MLARPAVGVITDTVQMLNFAGILLLSVWVSPVSTQAPINVAGDEPVESRNTTTTAGESSCRPGEGAMTLELMVDKAKRDGAVCLDGSPGGYYIQMAKEKTNSWQICPPPGLLLLFALSARCLAGWPACL